MHGQRNYGFSLNFSVTPMVKRLLIANVAVFAVTLLAPALFFDLFALQPDRILVRPWGLVTYMFLHSGFGHLAMNMLVLFFFGTPLEGEWGGKEFLRFYFVAGLGGAALSFFFPNSIVVGASGAIYGLMLAFAMNWPNAPIYIFGIFPVKAKYLVGFLFVTTLLSSLGQGGAGGGTAHLAHLGGLLAALVYLKADWRPGVAFEGIRTASGPTRRTTKRRLAIVPSDERVAKPQRNAEPARDWEQADERRMLDEVDRVLDKISAKGMAALSDDERALLDEVSRRRRSN